MLLSVSVATGCYRHIRISASASLFELHECILDAFDFFDDHLHVFFMNNSAWDDENGYYSPYIEDDVKLSTDYKLSDFGLKKDSKFLYIFDFGDDWRFSVKVLRVEDGKLKKPELVRAVGDPPPQYPDLDGEDDFFDEDDEDDLAEE